MWDRLTSPTLGYPRRPFLNRDLNPSDGARLACIDRSTFYDHKDDLLAYGVIKQTRTVNNSTMYQINSDNEAAKALGQLGHALMDIFAREMEGNDLES